MPTTTPIEHAEPLFHTWNMSEIYTGPAGTGAYVPKVGDMIIEIVGTLKSEYVVTSIGSDLVARWVKLTKEVDDGSIKENSLFATAGSTSETYLAYLDTSVTPHRLSLDARLLVPGTAVAYYKVFAGYNVSGSGEVISAVYNNSGVYVSENGTLELAGEVQGKQINTNVSLRTAVPCFTNASLQDAEVVTYVFYDTDGIVRDIRQVYIRNTAAVRRLNAASKEVVDVRLETPFLASVNSREINYPLNVPLNTMNLVGVVEYSDGSIERMGVDGTRFTVLGLGSYSPTIVGQKADIVLKYQLQDGEQAYGIEGANSNHISREYTIITQPAEGRYAVLLQPYPVWVSDSAGYLLNWWLHDLQRSINRDVTSLVTVDASYAAYLPKSYGVKQTLKAMINLNDVNPAYAEFYHVQNVDVMLTQPETNRPAESTTPNWYVTPQAGRAPMYNAGVYAKYYAPNANNNQLSLKGDFTIYTEWLDAYYYNSLPLYDPTTETRAPEPTHFTLRAGGVDAVYPIAQWNQTLLLTQALTNNAMAYLSFFKRTAQKDLQLSTVGVVLRRVNSAGNYV
jgi:hypothetical protein